MDADAAFRIRDSGSGTPDRELAVIERVDETPLSHGSELCCWIARWWTTAPGGDIEFESGPDGPSVTGRVPNGPADEPATPRAEISH